MKYRASDTGEVISEEFLQDLLEGCKIGDLWAIEQTDAGYTITHRETGKRTEYRVMDSNALLEAFRDALSAAREHGADGNDEAEQSAIQEALSHAEELDQALSIGAPYPAAWIAGRMLYRLAHIRHGTGFSKDARFLQL